MILAWEERNIESKQYAIEYRCTVSLATGFRLTK